MSQRPIGNMILDALRSLAGAIVRIIAFVIAWCFKLVSRVFDKIGNEILKFAEK